MERTINFKLWNNLIGVTTFLISAFVYLSTIEPTVSFWDCGEFLSCSSKLEVCHAPGNPLFLLIGHIASMLAGSDRSLIPIFVNGASALESALTIMFLFWTITWFCRKILASTWSSSTAQKVLILGAGFVGAMAYAVSDSFWFSAVEAEVYAMSSLFIAVIFWCITKWEESNHPELANRWLLLIAYLLGLGIGVHLLNLLAIPSIMVLYHLKKNPLTWRSLLKAMLLSILILGFIFAILIPGIPRLSSWFELIAVNGFKLPYNSGYAFGLLFIFLLITLGLYFSYRFKKVTIYNSIIYLSFIILGISTYGVIVIRSHDNPPINMNNPENPFALEYYLNREQYEKRDLLYGPAYNSPIADSKERSSYERFNGKYVSYPLNPEYVYSEGSQMFFPRMASSSPEHVKAYNEWVSIKGRPYTSTNANGKQEQVMIPTFGENLTFFFKYQLGFMYYRYFMWNFAGRQNDILGHGNNIYGNWITGIPFIDSALNGPQQKLPAWLKNNPGRNTYFLLPLLLGVIGLFFHYKSDKKNFTVLALLFFFTGIAIVLYLNEVPVVPRERDYVSVGSFYAFAIWIGIGIIACGMSLEQFFKKRKFIAVSLAIVSSLSVPTIMVAQNWDDHDRSHRYAVLEYARNYLESCEPNAILFTNADNDTYPLWYAQEVEGIRRDVQIILLPYLSINWYVDQMRKPSYNKPGIPMSIGQDKLISGQRTFLPIVERTDTTVDLKALLGFVCSDDDLTKVDLADGKKVNYIPSRKLSLAVNKDITRKYSFKSGLTPTASDSLLIPLKGSYLRLDHLLLLDILASNNWKRPIYFASVQEPLNLGLEKYLQVDGYAYKLTPFRNIQSENREIGVVDSETQYEKLMDQFSYKSLADATVYLDNTHVNIVAVVALRTKFAQLAETLIKEGKTEKGIKVLNRITAMLPHERIAYDNNILKISELYLAANQRTKAKQLLTKLKLVTIENLDYFQSLPKKYLGGIDFEIRLNLYIISELYRITENQNFKALSEEIKKYWKQLEINFLSKIQD